MSLPTSDPKLNSSFDILYAATVKAKEWGVSFVVFVGGYASSYTGDVEQAKERARFAVKNGCKAVNIKRIRA